MSWPGGVASEMRTTLGSLLTPVKPRGKGDHRVPWWLFLLAMLPLVGTLTVLGMYRPAFLVTNKVPEIEKKPLFMDLTKPVRDAPKRFKINTHLPTSGEGASSGSMGSYPFVPKHDLVRVEDNRPWWESDHDKNDTEDDHLVHRSLEEPLRRLIELVDQKGAVLKIQDAYRDEGIHAKRSLHKEGRAVDLTADGLSLEELAKLAWASGFDWVYNEWPKRGGAHVHASVKPIPAWQDGRFAKKD